jgi:glycosyltransferase involved in cell wall biosynthesis
MKVAQVSLRFDAPGGVETTVRELSHRLSLAGESVRVYSSDLYDEGRWERRRTFAPVVDGVPVERFPVYKRLIPGLTMPLMVGLVGALARDAPDVIHAHSHRYGHVLEAALVARSQEIPLVVSTHYHPADRREPLTKRGLLRLQDHLFGTTAYRIARALVVETDLEARRLAGFAPKDRIHVIPPGIDLDEWSEKPGPPPEGLPGRYVLYAGRIAPNKGLSTLLRAFAGLPAATRPPLVLMGTDWGQRPGLEALAQELGISRELHWTGHVDSPAQYRAVFGGAAAFVLPSEWEAFGLVLLEAMASGVPVVATNVGGVPEVLDGGKVGWLVPYGDAHALSDGIAHVLGDRKLAEEMREAGRTRVKLYTWQRAVEAHRSLYRAVVGTPDPTPPA